MLKIFGQSKQFSFKVLIIDPTVNSAFSKIGKTPMARRELRGIALVMTILVLLGRSRICLLYTSPSPRD